MRYHLMNFNIIDWRITASCNNKCEYCYASQEIAELPVEKEDKLIDNIKRANFSAVCISGGEPLINIDRVERIIKKLVSKRIQVYLSTNGILYTQYKDRIESHIAKLSLPIDGYDEATCILNGRSVDSFYAVKDILEYYKKHYRKFPIKISTVVTSNNCQTEFFEKMYTFLKNYSDAIDVWKIYEIIPENRGEENFSKLRVENLDLLRKYIDKIKSSEHDFNIQFIGKNERNKAYFIIRPDGSVIVPKHNENDTEEKIIGNITEEDFSRLHLEDFINLHNYESNSVIRNVDKPYSVAIKPIDELILRKLDYSPFVSYDKLRNNLMEDAKSLGINEKEIEVNEIEKRVTHLWKLGVIKEIIPILNISRLGLSEYTIDFYLTGTFKENEDRLGNIISRYDNIAWCIKCIDEENDNLLIYRVAVFVNTATAASEASKISKEIIYEIQRSIPCFVESKISVTTGNRIYKQEYFSNTNINYLVSSVVAPKVETPNQNQKIEFDDDEILFFKFIRKINIATQTLLQREIDSTVSLLFNKTKGDRSKRIFDAISRLRDCSIL